MPFGTPSVAGLAGLSSEGAGILKQEGGIEVLLPPEPFAGMHLFHMLSCDS